MWTQLPTERRTSRYLFKMTPAERQTLDRLAAKHTEGNIAALLRKALDQLPKPRSKKR